MNAKQQFSTLLMVAVFSMASVAATLAKPEIPPEIDYTNALVAEVPWSIQIVKIGRGKGSYEIQCRHAGGGALGLNTLSEQVAAAETEQSESVAAINGGFYLRDYTQTNAYTGCPRGLQIVAGEVLSAPDGNACLWLDYSGQPHVENVASHFEITWPDGRITPFGLNGPRTNDAIELYTPADGASTHTSGGRELVLEPPPGGPWLPLRMERDYPARVREIRAAGNTSLSSNSMVPSLSPAIMEQFQGVTTGAGLQISTRSLPNLLNAKNAISGGPVVLRNGDRKSVV